MVKTPFRPSKALAGALAAGLLGWGCAQVAGLDDGYEPFPPAGAGEGGSAGGGAAGTAGMAGGGQGGAGAGAAGIGGGLLNIGKPGLPCFEEGSSACFDNAHKLILTCKRTPPVTGGLVWTELDYCRGDDLCDSRPRSEVGSRSGTCQPAVSACLGQQPGARLCVGKTLHICGPDLVSSDVEECGSEDLCGHTLARSMTKCVRCEGGTYSCDGDVRRLCKDDWLNYDYIEDCAQKNLFCNASTTLCSQNRCEAGDYNCEGDDLQQCVDPKLGFTHVLTCQGENPICDQEGKQCDVCGPEDARCRTHISGEKNDREVCAPGGQGWSKAPCAAPNPVCRGIDGDAKCVQCTAVEDCPGRTLCNPRDCNLATNECNDKKLTGPLPAGGQQVANDCKNKVCDDGNEVDLPDLADKPLDNNPDDCLQPACGPDGTPTLVPRPANSACAGGTGVCNATGLCGTCSVGATTCASALEVSTCDENGNPGAPVACSSPGPHCENGQCFACTVSQHCAASGPCKQAECNDHVCGERNVTDGTSLPDPAAGDCQALVCESGLPTSREDPSDKPPDVANDCVFPGCTDGVPVQTPFNAGGGCVVNDVPGVCDDVGNCVPNMGDPGTGGQTAGASGGGKQGGDRRGPVGFVGQPRGR